MAEGGVSAMLATIAMKTPLLQRLFHVGVWIEVAAKRMWERCARLFLSKAEVAKRVSGRFEMLKRREMEAERLDRLRHPSDYQGR